MATQLEKLRAFRESQNPALATLSRIQILKGDKGDTGAPGKDGKDGQAFVGSKGERGLPGYDGRNGFDGKDGKHGRDGKDGKDGKDGISPSTHAIITELKKLPVSFKDIKDAPDLTDLPALIKFLKAGGFRGGGDTVAAGSNVTITVANGVKTIAATGSAPAIPTGTVNGSNLTFTAATTPTIVFTEGGHFINGFGVTITGLTIVFDAGLAPQQWIKYV